MSATAYDKYQAAVTNRQEGAAESSEASKKLYAFIDNDIRNEATPAVDPISTSANRQRLNYATMALNYANVPHANILAEAATRLSMGKANNAAVKKALTGTLAAAIPMDHINAVAAEIAARMEAVENLMAGVEAAISSASGSFLVENKVIQAKTDIKLLASQLSIITDLIDKISGASTNKAAGPTNIKKIIDMLMAALDIISQLVSYVEQVADKMTPEEYDRLMKLVAALDKTKTTTNKPTVVEILQTVLVVALDMLKPYITNLILMLTLECFTALMSVIKKIPGAGGTFPPPLDMIPAMTSLVVMVISGNLEALMRRLKSDIQVIYEFMRASVIVAVSSDAALDAAELKVAEEEAAASNSIIPPTKTTLSTDTGISTAEVHNQQIDSATSDAIDTCQQTSLTNNIVELQLSINKEILVDASAEKLAIQTASTSIAEADAAKQNLVTSILLHDYRIVHE